MTTIHAGQWRLERAELVNWGTFSGHHVLDVARQGFLLTGHSGSGKSSLVDAISTVLTPRGKLRFNAAAGDGAGTRDRSVVTYMRGAWRRRPDEETGEVGSDFLRTGATWSGILLRYGEGGKRPPVTLVKLFHLKRGASTPAEVSEVSAILREPVGLLELAGYAQNGIEARRLARDWPNAQVSTKHSAFEARFTRLLGISGANALMLLHRTQSAKNLGSLDDLFRTYMLDEPATRRMVDTAVAQFADLSQAHHHVLEARAQIDHLRQLEPLAAGHARHREAVELSAALLEALLPFKTAWKRELALQARDRADAALRTAEQEREVARHAVDDDAGVLERARLAVAERGGSALALHQSEVRRLQAEADHARADRARVHADIDTVGIAFPANLAEFEELQAAGRREAIAHEEWSERAREEMESLRDERSRLRARHQEVTAQLTALRGTRSNMDQALLAARSLVCRDTGLPASVLPFCGELIEVLPEHGSWQGAIERVLRPLARVMLVPEAHRDRVAQAVDRHHLGTRLVHEVVPRRVEPVRRPRTDSSAIHKVAVASGSMADWLNWKLSQSYDYACVMHADELRDVERGVTRAGQVKRGTRSFEKDDRWKVDDRTHWVLGVDNAAKVDLFLDSLREVTAEIARLDGALGEGERARQRAERRIEVLTRLAEYTWAELDVAGATAALARAQQELDELLASDGDLRRAQQAEAEAAESLGEAQAAVRTLDETCAARRSELARIRSVLEELGEDSGPAVPLPWQRELEERFHRVRTNRVITYESIDDAAFKVQQALTREKDAADAQRLGAENAIVEIEREFSLRWPSMSADLAVDIVDVGGFLALLARLLADRLPEFEHRFFDLLENQSRKNVGQLANEIRRAPGEIRERIRPVNDSLARSVFDQGRYLRIQVDDNRSTAAKQFLADLGTIASDSWAGVDRETAEDRFELMRSLMARLTSSEAADRQWQDQCLDTRRHVRFTGIEVTGAGEVVNVHDSGAGLSGGQKQKLVIFCLAAALRYQLTPDGDVPSYGTIVLDEAFDKADTAFTRMAMDIFVEFGFHMILATPLKLLQVLEDYVGGVGLATCREMRESQVGLVSFEGLLGQPGEGEPVDATAEGTPSGEAVTDEDLETLFR